MSGGYQVSLGDRQTQAFLRTSVAGRCFFGRRRFGHVGADAPGQTRIWPTGGGQISPQQLEGTPDGEVDDEVFGWRHLLQQVEHTTYPVEPASGDEDRGLPEAFCYGSDVGPPGGGLCMGAG